MFNFGNKRQDQCSCNKETDLNQDKAALGGDENECAIHGGSLDDTASCLQELALYKDRFVRLGADFQNYKKRVEKDKVDWMDKARADVFVGLLQIVDNFDRALDEAKSTQDPQLMERLKGFEMIHRMLYDFLKEHGVEAIAQNSTFDPLVHEAIAQFESPDHQSGQVIEVFEKGFSYKGKNLRTAKVSVAK